MILRVYYKTNKYSLVSFGPVSDEGIAKGLKGLR
jgi:hypothetical protein